ncbi:MAG: serine/threonine protein kinase [Gammaproteobacteria bacterium]|nr:serine/threonine protein kinase [Gammaproteobacteria bacterium]NIR81632.1 serine/threonine protein kinase [Gammaproteobacteria bacterium]NIR88183.1 serine/threonine protein kinase [Gammaproteobacteria bacterium]NIU02744.1 serine/threonine protein kinase [Gammaproteobacteria bacterium]NIV73343.1 protein kinase [Gammaproteobacteria bacterium]
MKIPGYRIKRLIGKGGMASVYLATQQSLNRPVALKVLHPSAADTPEFSKRFVREGRLIASLRHSNIITIHDIDVVDGLHYISMEYVDGGDLKRRISRGVAPDAALSIVETIGSCLHFAHKAGVVHRDVSPANILFRKDGTPLLTDFGIAKAQRTRSDLTTTGKVLGTPAYLSPERAKGQRVDGRADIYGLGVILYEMLVGENPFRGESDVDTILNQVESPIPKLPRELADLQPLLDRMLAKRPKDRFRDASALVEAVRRVRDEGAPAAGKTTRRAARRHRATRGHRSAKGRTAVLIAAVLAVLAGTMVSSSVWHGEPKGSSARLPVNERGVERLLRLGDRALADYRLTVPTGDNALHYYRRVLARDPRNARAARGLDAIAERYVTLADERLSDGDHETARQYVDRGLEVRPFHVRLLLMREQVRVRSTFDALLESLRK